MSRREALTREAAERDPTLLASLVPDEPPWLPLRGLLRSGRCRVFTEPTPEDGFLVRSTDYPLAAAAAAPTLGLFQWMLAMRGAGGTAPTGPMELLTPTSSAGWWSKRLTRWRQLEVRLLTPAAGVLETLDDTPVTWWGSDTGLAPSDDELPAEVRRELRFVLDQGQQVAVALDHDRPVAFCHAPLQSETLWDVAVYTVAAYRRCGHAGRAFAAMARRQLAAGRRPVWSAYGGNGASLALAERLGFEPADTLAAFRKPH